MIAILKSNPLLLLFVVAALGYLLGQVHIRGVSLGVSAVLFVGIAVGALDQDLKLPEVFYQLGLVLFVYTVGLSSGPGFFASFRQKGLRNTLLVAGILVFAFALALLSHALLGLTAGVTAGVFAGSLTNTPALAAVLDHIRESASPALRDALLNEPVISYSVTYPLGVVEMILAMVVVERLWHIDFKREEASLRELGAAGVQLASRTILVGRPRAAGATIKELTKSHQWDVIFTRIKHDERVELATPDTQLAQNDLVTVVGTHQEIDRVTSDLGTVSQERLEIDRSEMDFRRIFVSNRHLAGMRVSDLNLPQQFGAIITRLRRGDVEFLVHGDTVLELGDRVRVLTRPQNMDAVSEFFGDSYRALSEVDILTFGLGVALGLLLGILPIPLPGGVTLTLGLAGGPLVAALVLGAVGRTGPMVWSLPYSANLILRQMGLILFLAGIGTRSGYAFVSTLAQGGGVAIFLAGAAITALVALTTLWIGYRLLKIPLSLLSGILAGLQTQPAVLGFALERTGNDLPNIGYASVYPVALIAKILLAQLIVILLR